MKSMENFNIDNEGFVGASLLTGNYLGYLYYLTYGNRALIYSSKNSYINNLNYKMNNLEYYYRYKNIRNNESIKSLTKNIELVMSYSKHLNRIFSIYYGLENWENEYSNNTLRILENNLIDFTGFLSFKHTYDKTGYRIHNHIMIYPYKKTDIILLGKKHNKIQSILEKDILENIKIDYRKFAKEKFLNIPELERKFIIDYISNNPVIPYPIISKDDMFNSNLIDNLSNISKIKQYIELSNEYMKKESEILLYSDEFFSNNIISNKQINKDNIMQIFINSFKSINVMNNLIKYYTSYELFNMMKIFKINKNSNLYLMIIDIALYEYQIGKNNDKMKIIDLLFELKVYSSNELKSIITNIIYNNTYNSSILKEELKLENESYNSYIDNRMKIIDNLHDLSLKQKIKQEEKEKNNIEQNFKKKRE